MAQEPYGKLATKLMVRQYTHMAQVLSLDCFSLHIIFTRNWGEMVAYRLVNMEDRKLFKLVRIEVGVGKKRRIEVQLREVQFKAFRSS